MPPNLLRRGGNWYARRAIPRRHWERLGKRELVRTLGTGDLTVAQRLLPVALTALDREIDKMTGGAAQRPTEPSWLIDAARQARAYALARGEDPRYSESGEPGHGELAFDAALERWEEVGGDPEVARDAHAAFLGKNVLLLSEAITRHLGELQVAGVVPSWIRAKKRELESFQAFTGDVPVRAITRQLASAYVSAKVNLSGASAHYRRNRVGVLVSFGESLVNSGDLESSPFDRLRKLVRESSRGDAEKSKRPYTPDELLKVFTELRSRCPEGDPMVSAVAIAAYTGMRIEEVCTLRAADCADGALRITGKTKNRNSSRKVPVHPAIAGLVEHLRTSTTDGYLLSGLTRAGVDQRRAHALSNRFRRYLRRMGLPSQVDTHSLRRSLQQRCEDAGIPRDTTKLLVGHSRGDLTYGLYSTGPDWQRLVDAMAKVTYGPEVDTLVKAL